MADSNGLPPAEDMSLRRNPRQRDLSAPPRNPNITYRAVITPETNGPHVPVTGRVAPNESPGGNDFRTHIERINPGDNPAAVPGLDVPH